MNVSTKIPIIYEYFVISGILRKITRLDSEKTEHFYLNRKTKGKIRFGLLSTF